MDVVGEKEKQEKETLERNTKQQWAMETKTEKMFRLISVEQN